MIRFELRWNEIQRGHFQFSLRCRSNESIYTLERLHHEAARLARLIAALDPDPNFPVGILFHSQESQVLNYVAALSLGLLAGGFDTA